MTGKNEMRTTRLASAGVGRTPMAQQVSGWHGEGVDVPCPFFPTSSLYLLRLRISVKVAAGFAEFQIVARIICIFAVHLTWESSSKEMHI